MRKPPGSARLHEGAPHSILTRLASRLTGPPQPRARVRTAVVIAVVARLLALFAVSVGRSGGRSRRAALRLDALAVGLTYPRVRSHWRRLPDLAKPSHGVAPAT